MVPISTREGPNSLYDREHIPRWVSQRPQKLGHFQSNPHVHCQLPNLEQYVVPLSLRIANEPSLATVNLPANTQIQYKYIRIYNGAVTWESDPDNEFTTAPSGAQTLDDVWR